MSNEPTLQHFSKFSSFPHTDNCRWSGGTGSVWVFVFLRADGDLEVGTENLQGTESIHKCHNLRQKL